MARPLDAHRIIRTYLWIAGLYTLAAALIWGVNTLFLLDAGLDIFGVFVANAGYTAGMVIFEIPTGVLADTRGRRLSFLLGAVVLLLSTLGYVLVARLGGGVGAFTLVSVLIGLGFTFYSGAVEAWLVDALASVGHEGALDRVFAREGMVSGAAMLVGTLGGGLLGSLDLALPYVLRAALLGVAFAVAFVTMHDLGFTPRALRAGDLGREMAAVARASIAYGWRRRSVRLLMLSTFVQWGVLLWAFYAWQPYLLELLGRDAVWVAGVVAALISLAIIAGNALVERLSQACGKRTTLLLWAGAAQFGAAVGIGLTGSFWWAVGFLVLLAGAMGVTTPVRQSYLHQVIPSEQRASVISFDSLFQNAGGVVGQTGLGWLSRAHSIAAGYVVGGATLLLAVPFFLRLRRLGEAADRIDGGALADPRGRRRPELSYSDPSPDG